MLKDLNKKDRIKIITIIAVVAAIFVGIFFGLMLLSLKGGDKTIAEDLGIEENTDAFAYFENMYLVQYSVSKKANGKIFLDLQNTIVRHDEIATAPSSEIVEIDENGGTRYTSTISEASFKRHSLNTGYAYTFDVSISDGRLYKCILLPDSETKGDLYYGLVVYNESNAAKEADFYITFLPNTTTTYNRDIVIKNMTEQMKSLSSHPLKNPIVK